MRESHHADFVTRFTEQDKEAALASYGSAAYRGKCFLKRRQTRSRLILPVSCENGRGIIVKLSESFHSSNHGFG